MRFLRSEVGNVLMKFCEKPEHAKGILEGHIYMKESGYFRRLENGFRGDPYDGRILVQEEYKKVPITYRDGTTYEVQLMSDDIYGLPNDDKIPIFCATQLDESIIDSISDSMGVFCEEFKREISQFGRYAVCISVDEFLKKSDCYVAEKELCYQFGKITYINYADIFPPTVYKENVSRRLQQFSGMIYKHSGEIIEGYYADTSELSLFQKNTSYAWQNEWRFVLKNDKNDIIPETQDYHVMSVGKFESGRTCETKDIINATIDLTQ